ncbi:MAG: hypothetical protein WC935_00045 [Thermoleophilia bacterium]
MDDHRTEIEGYRAFTHVDNSQTIVRTGTRGRSEKMDEYERWALKSEAWWARRERDDARRQLAETEDDLAEAAGLVWRLIEWWRDPNQDFEDLPRWLQREIDR